MVIRPDLGLLCLTEQPEHARMTGELVEAWGGNGFEPVGPIDAVRLAAEMHDAGWAEFDAEPLVNPATQRPYSFLDIPQNVHVAAHTRTVERASQADPYAGLLTSLHSAGLYRRRYGYLPHIPFRPVAPEHEAAVDRFLAEQDQLQDDLQYLLRPEAEELWTHYRWFQLWDALSLYVCMLHAENVGDGLLLARVPFRPGGPETDLHLKALGDARFGVAPWPFKPAQLALRWQARLLPDQPYTSDAALRAAYAAAPLQQQTVTLVPQ